MDLIFTYSIAPFFAFGFDSLKVLYLKKMKMKNLMINIINLFFINLMIIINLKYLKNIIFNKINVFIKYILGCQSFYLFFKKFQSFKNLFEKFIGWEILLVTNSLEIGIELGFENNFNFESLIVSFSSPSQEQEQEQEQDTNEISDSGIENGYDSEYEIEENYIPKKSIDKDSENNTQLEKNNIRENNKTEIVDEDISNNNYGDIEEGIEGKLKRNFGFYNLASLWKQNNNNNSSNSTSNNNESNTSDSNANSSSSTTLNNNENSTSTSTNTNNYNSKGRFYIDEDSDSEFGDFDEE